MAHELVPALLEKGEGHIVFISSLAGHVASPHSSLYSATKFGLRGFAFGLREDLAGNGVGVSVVSPGFVRDAGMFADSGAAAAAGDGDDDARQKVGKAVARAIERDKVEITVAPLAPGPRRAVCGCPSPRQLDDRAAARWPSARRRSSPTGQTRQALAIPPH